MQNTRLYFAASLLSAEQVQLLCVVLSSINCPGSVTTSCARLNYSRDWGPRFAPSND
jgi:hypothetical protein